MTTSVDTEQASVWDHHCLPKIKTTINCFMFYYIISQVMACSNIWLFKQIQYWTCRYTSNIWKPWQLHTYTVSESRWSKIRYGTLPVGLQQSFHSLGYLVFTDLPCILYSVQLSITLFTSTPWFSSSWYTHVQQYIQ